MVRKWFSAVLVLSCLFYSSQGNEVFGDEFGRTGSLIILVKSSKPAYEIGEPIFLTLTLTNHTTVPLIVNQRFNHYHDLELDLFHEPFGPISIKSLPLEDLTKENYVRLEVNEKILKTLPDLSEITVGPLKEGRYGLRIFYKNKETPRGEDTWTGRIATNRIWFTIKPSEKI